MGDTQMLCVISHVYFSVISRLIQSWYIRGKMSVFLYFKMLRNIVFIRIIKN